MLCKTCEVMIAPNIFKPRNDWNVRTSNCRRYSTSASVEHKLNNIITEVTDRYEISRAVFVSRNRKREVVEARMMYFKRARDMTTASLRKIGSMVDTGDHSNVIYGVKQVNNVPILKRKYNELFNGLEPLKKYIPIKRDKAVKPELTPTKVHLSLTGKPIYETK